jgi:methyl-accepting chemotaxis protein
VTQQNAALVEEVTAATLAFEEESKRLSGAVSRFKIAGGTQPSVVRASQGRIYSRSTSLGSGLPAPREIAGRGRKQGAPSGGNTRS